MSKKIIVSSLIVLTLTLGIASQTGSTDGVFERVEHPPSTTLQQNMESVSRPKPDVQSAWASMIDIHNSTSTTTSTTTTTTLPPPPPTTTTAPPTTQPPPPPPTTQPAPPVDNGSVWDRLAQCESGGNWHINTGNGYSGGIQAHPQTWNGYGGQEFAPYAYQATREQQIIVAERILAGQGWGAWPACSRQLGLR